MMSDPRQGSLMAHPGDEEDKKKESGGMPPNSSTSNAVPSSSASLVSAPAVVVGSSPGGVGAGERPTQLKEDAQILYDYLRMTPCPKLRPVDCMLVLGSNDVRVARCAALLFKEGLAPLIVFSGSRGNFTEHLQKTEAEWLADEAVACGVPRSAVLLEKRATNTGENIRYCRQLLGDHWGGLDRADAKTYIVVQKPFMLRRAWATFRKQWPGPTFNVAAPAVPLLLDYVDETIGMPFDAVVNAMCGDMQRLLYYAEVKDFQVPVDVPDRVWSALGRLVGRGYTSHLLTFK